MAKKGKFAQHANRVGNRVSERAKRFVADARSGTYDHLRLSADVANSITDVVDFWSGLFGGGASPSVGIADLGSAPAALWKAGRSITVLVNDPVPGDAAWVAVTLQRSVAGGGTSHLDLQTVSIQDDEGFELRVTVMDTGGPVMATGEYFGILLYDSVSAGGRFFAAVIKATLT
jgi:hypothetical protein